MENDSLAELKTLIEEELYLIPEDRDFFLNQLDRTPASQPATTASATPVAEVIAVAAIHEEPEPDPIPVRGNFSKGVLILHEEVELKAELMDMLVKMINACGHSMGEVGMIASDQLQGRSMEEFKNLNAHKVLKFGRIDHQVNTVPARPYESHTEKAVEYLFADSLTVISTDVTLKKKLWASLQQLFKLS